MTLEEDAAALNAEILEGTEIPWQDWKDTKNSPGDRARRVDHIICVQSAFRAPSILFSLSAPPFRRFLRVK